MPNWLAQRAAALPEHPALLAEGVRWSFAELDAQVSMLARKLAGWGVRAGERVALLLQNSPGYAALLHAAPRLGVVLVPLNTRLAAPELAWQLADSGAHALIFDAPNTQLAEAACAQAGAPIRAADLAALQQLAAPEFVPHDTIDLAALFAIIYTSGTSGRPKGAMLSYGNVWWSAIGSALNLGTHTNDHWLAAMPLFHIGGLSIVLRAAIYGCTATIHPGFDVAAVHQAIDETGITIVSVVSAMLQRLLDARGMQPYPPTLRCMLLGGGPAPQPLLAACAARGLPVVQTYGLTEAASQVATLAPADALRHLGSAGRPLLPTELRIEQEGAPAPPGTVGEIVVRGPTVMLGYINAPEAGAQALRGGWLHTGDLGYLDDQGYLYVVSRRSDLIIAGGENIYPAEIEAVLLAHPAIAEAAVVGVPDARWGAVPVALVAPRAGFAPPADELIAFCRARLAGYKVPRAVRFVGALPRNAAGKLLRDAARAIMAE